MITVRKQPFRCIVAISMLYLALYVASYPVAYKVIQLGPFIETGAIFLFPFCYTLGDIVAEVYGYKLARQMIWMSIVCGFIFCASIISIIHIASPPFWHKETEYLDVLDPMLKVFFAMTIATTIGSFVNLFVITKWKILVNGRYFWLRSIASSSIGELFFSVIAGAITFIGVAPPGKVIWLILNGWVFKVIYSIIMAAPASYLVVLLKRIEKIEVRDYSIEFNPFKLSLDEDSPPIIINKH